MYGAKYTNGVDAAMNDTQALGLVPMVIETSGRAALSAVKSVLDQTLSDLKDARREMEQRRAELTANPTHERLPKAEDYDRLLRARVDAAN